MFVKIINNQIVKCNRVTSSDYTLTTDMVDKGNLPDGWQWIDGDVNTDEVANDFPVLSRKQLRLALLRMGKTANDVQSVIDAMSDGVEKETARIVWEDAVIYHRDHSLITQIATVFGFTSEQIDAEWKTGE